MSVRSGTGIIQSVPKQVPQIGCDDFMIGKWNMYSSKNEFPKR